MARLTADDFFNGLFATLAYRNTSPISIQDNRFDEAVSHAYEKLIELSPKLGLDIRFNIQLHSFHNDSLVARNAIYSAAQIGIVSLDNPEYQKIRFAISPTQAEKLLNDIPGGKELFSILAEEFLKNYNMVTA